MDETLSQALAAVLRSELAARRWTVGELAEGAEMTRVDLYRKLRGERELRTDEQSRLARALGVSVSYLMHEAERRMERRQNGEGNEIVSLPKG